MRHAFGAFGFLSTRFSVSGIDTDGAAIAKRLVSHRYPLSR